MSALKVMSLKQVRGRSGKVKGTSNGSAFQTPEARSWKKLMLLSQLGCNFLSE